MARFEITVQEILDSVLRGMESLRAPADAKQRTQEEFGRMTPAISEAASACMDAFITTELDFEGARQIGLGRLSAEVPRLGTRHRAFLSNLVPADVAQLGALIKRRIACGYVFYDLVLCRGKEPGDSRFSRKSLAGESLFERWVPRMYGPMVSHLGQPSEMQRELLGASGTEIDLMSFFARFGVGWGDADLPSCRP